MLKKLKKYFRKETEERSKDSPFFGRGHFDGQKHPVESSIPYAPVVLISYSRGYLVGAIARLQARIEELEGAVRK